MGGSDGHQSNCKLAVMDGLVKSMENAAHFAAIGVELRNIGLHVDGLADKLYGETCFAGPMRQHAHQMQSTCVPWLLLQYLS